jgi:hypothetical protein
MFGPMIWTDVDGDGRKDLLYGDADSDGPVYINSRILWNRGLGMTVESPNQVGSPITQVTLGPTEEMGFGKIFALKTPMVDSNGCGSDPEQRGCAGKLDRA